MKKGLLLMVIAILAIGCSFQNKANVKEKEITKLSKKVEQQEPEEQKKRVLKGTKKFKMVKTPSLEGAKLSKISEKKIGIYLPPSYNEKVEKEYPVIYFLEGYSGTVNCLEEEFDFFGIADRLIENKKLNEVIVVSLDGYGYLPGSFYVNSPVMGNWEDYVINDIIGYIDGNYRTIDSKEGRAISGISMGGFGALNLAMKNSDMFNLVYSFSPGIFDEKGVDQALFPQKRVAESFVNRINRFKEYDQEKAKKKFKFWVDGSEFNLSYGITFAPDENVPYVKAPYEFKGDNLEVKNEVINLWNSGFGNWKEKTEKYKENLKSLDGIVIDYGTEDYYTWIPKGCEYLDDLWKEEGIN
ncbi:MAG: alpha/beta hydrolase, partial [Fusobacteriota bacterium]